MRFQPSLKWLVDRRARLSGEIIRIEETLPSSRLELTRTIIQLESRLERLQKRLHELRAEKSEFDDSLRHLESLRQDLSAIDQALAQHAVKIVPETIKPIRSQSAIRYFGYGEMTRQIYACLKKAYPEPRTAMEVTEFILAETGLEISESELHDLRFRVRQRLSHLTWQFRIARLHEAKTSEEGRWTLLYASPPR